MNTHRLRALAGSLLAVAFFGASPAASAQTKKELVQRILTAQQPEVEQLARTIAERPAVQMMQEAGLAIQRQVPQDKREAVGRAVEAEVKKYVDEAVPIVRDRALKLAPTTIGPILESKMTEDELKQLVAWLDSPVNKKYQSLAPEMRNGFVQQVLRESGPLIDPKLQALDGRVRVALGLPPAPAPTATPPPAAAPASTAGGRTNAAPPRAPASR